MARYEQNALELAAQVGIPQDRIFDYQFSPLAELFDNFYYFCQDNLDIHAEGYQIAPAKFYYRNERESINACAYQRNGVALIEMNAALLIAM